MVIGIIFIGVFIILYFMLVNSYSDVKKNGLRVKAQVLGYFVEYPNSIQKTSYIVYQFSDDKGIIHTIAEPRRGRHGRLKYTIEPIRKFKENALVNIIYKEREHDRVDFEKKLIVLDNGKEVELTDDYDNFNIIYNGICGDEASDKLLKISGGIIGLVVVALVVTIFVLL